MKLSKELKGKLSDSDWEGLGIANLNQIADLKLSILMPVKIQIVNLNLTLCLLSIHIQATQ